MDNVRKKKKKEKKEEKKRGFWKFFLLSKTHNALIYESSGLVGEVTGLCEFPNLDTRKINVRNRACGGIQQEGGDSNMPKKIVDGCASRARSSM